MLGDAEARDVEAQAAVEAEAAGAGTVFGAMGTQHPASYDAGVS